MKALLVLLLAIDMGWFAWSGAASKAFDSAAWLTLLVLFDVETRVALRTPHRTRTLLLRALRLGAAAAVIAATLRYVFEGNVLDTLNSVLWIGVVVLLETQLRFAAVAARGRTVFAAIAALLYGSLAVLVGVWAWRGEWFDAYDALLWLIAFAALELEVTSSKPAQGSATPRYTSL